MIPQSTFDVLEKSENVSNSFDFNNLYIIPGGSHKHIEHWDNQMLQDDGVWITTAGFAIFTMTSGFGLLESGRVASKDQVNIMVKNVIDVIFGGLAYWMFGFGFSFGSLESMANPYIGIGDYFFDPTGPDENTEGWAYASFIYQMSFATTTSAIVSAGMAERVNLKAYIVISYVMTLMHAVPAHWVWSEHGILWKMGVIDFAGCSVVHLVGGVAGLIATVYLGPRHNRFGKYGKKQLSNPSNAILGTFMLWWGWLVFNTGSTYGITHGKWNLAGRSAISTVIASTGGGLAALLISNFREKKIQIDMLIDGLLSALVASSASCACLLPWQALLVGIVSAWLALMSYPVLEWIEIDDPVGVVPVHVIGAIWGMLSTGLFAREDPLNSEITRKQNGLIYGGGFNLLGKQFLAIGVISLWAAVVSLFTMILLQHSPLGLRLSVYEEQLGADLREHGLQGHCVRQYEAERVMDAKKITQVMLHIIKWRTKAKKGAERRQRAREAQEMSSIASIPLPVPN